MSPEISLLHRQLASHPVFSQLSSIANIRIFMTYHVFAVWDFMSLLKALQREITCVEVPWVESKYDPELVQLINEIVLSEESDVDQHGNPCSHFSLYIQAMKEIGANAKLVSKFIKTKNTDLLPKEIANIICYHLGLAQKGKIRKTIFFNAVHFFFVCFNNNILRFFLSYFHFVFFSLFFLGQREVNT